MTSRAGQLLRDRWGTPEFGAHRAEASRVWTGELSPTNFSLRTEEGRADLRGFRFPRGSLDPFGVVSDTLVEQRVATMRWEDSLIHDVDFTAADTSEWSLDNVEIANCVFDDATCENWSVWRSDITDTTFRRAKLTGSTLGVIAEGRPDIWTRVDLTRADLRSCYFFDSDYHQVTFDHAKLDLCSFERATLDHCTFAGKLRRLQFDGRTTDEPHKPHWSMDEVDMTRCTFEDVQIYNYDTSTLRLPDDSGLLLIPDAEQTLLAARRLLQGSGDPSAASDIRVIDSTLEMGGWLPGHDILFEDHYPTLKSAIRRVLER